MAFKSKYLLIIMFCSMRVDGQLLKIKEKITGSNKTPAVSKEIRNETLMLNHNSPYKIIKTVAGSGLESREAESSGKDDRPGREARFYKPNDIISDGAGGFIIADFLNYRVRRMSGDYIVSTIAGNSQGQEDGTLSEGQLYSPVSICLDKNGDIIVADKNKTYWFIGKKQATAEF